MLDITNIAAARKMLQDMESDLRSDNPDGAEEIIEQGWSDLVEAVMHQCATKALAVEFAMQELGWIPAGFRR